MRLTLALAATASFLVLGCDSGGGGPSDAGTGGMDATTPVDSGMMTPTDGGGPPVCMGTPMPCAGRSEATCEDVIGCNWSSCVGSALSCSTIDAEADCNTTQGCRWSGTSCGGTVTPCSELDGTQCTTTEGCTVAMAAVCSGLARRCETLTREQCSMQPGCTEIVRPDAGPRPDGGMCDETRGIECDGDWRGNNPRTGMPFCADCDASRCCSPQSGRFMCVDRDAAGRCPAADIFVDTDRIVGEYTVVYQNFEPGDCAIAEGCVGGPGVRRLLRFDTWTPNQGGADLFLGATPADGMDTEIYDWSECHGHHHFNTYAEYELLDESGAIAATGHKQAFCLLDFYSWPDPMSSRAAVYDCGYQGIQRGWQDVYGSHLDCQWVDVTDVAPGDYQLHIALNTSHLLNEEDYGNNEAIVDVTIPPDAPDVDPTLACATTGDEGLARDCGWTREGEHTCTPG